MSTWEDIEPTWEECERLFEEMERKREITSRYAKLRASIIGNTTPQIIAHFSEDGNLEDIKSVYPPYVESALKEIDHMETLELDELNGSSEHYRAYRQY